MTDDTAPGELVRRRAEEFQRIVDEGLANDVRAGEFLDSLKKAGATPAEAADYGRQFLERKAERPSGSPTPGSDPDTGRRETTPEGLDNDQRAAFQQARDAKLANAAV